MENRSYTKARFITGATGFGLGAFILFAFIVMWLWNHLMPAIFSLGMITFWQAAGLLLLSKILFSGGCHSRHWNSDRRKKLWHSRLEEKWAKIPEEKRAEFAQKMEEKGFHHHSAEDESNQKEK